MKSPSLPQYCDTKTAALALNRQAATLRKWASTDTGPIRPVRINGRLAWSVDALCALLRGEDRTAAAPAKGRAK
jgi:hypothetical protein